MTAGTLLGLTGVPIPFGFYLPHNRFEQVLTLLMHRIKNPNPYRARGALVVSAPENGKSTLLRAVRSSVDRVFMESQIPDSIFSVYFDAPVGSTWRDLFESIGDQIGVPLPERGRGERFMTPIVKGLRDRSTKVILVDELNNLVSGTDRSQHMVLDFMKSLSNRLGIPLIAAGTLRALSAVELDPQYLSRWPPTYLPAWPFDREYLALLKGLELEMHLPIGTFSGRDQAPQIWQRAQGLVGLTVQLLNDSLALAISQGADSISLEHINQSNLLEANLHVSNRQANP